MRVRSAAVIICIHALLVLVASQAAACTTPVYRYAMINWIPAPYRFYHFHEGQISEEDAAVNRVLDELAIDELVTTNIMFRPVDFANEDQMKLIPRLVKKTWESHDKGSMYLVMTPWGAELFTGKLDEETVRAMVDSPLRKKICTLLNEGKTGVLLTLESNDEAEDKRAAKVIADSLAKVDEIGKSEDVSPDFPKDIDVGLVTVSRTDPAEKWLVKMLLSFEEDLNEPKLASSAMVFAVFGRGTAMLPYIGKGISEDNMIDCVFNLSGPCSCTIKSNCPAEDILMQWNWNDVAEKMAEQEAIAKYGPMDAREPGAETSQKQPNDEPQENKPSQEGTRPQQAPAKVEMPAPIAKALAEGDTVAEPDQQQRDLFTGRVLWLLAAGLAAATTLVVSIGYLLSPGRQ